MIEWLLHLFIKDYKSVNALSVRTAYGSLAGWVGIVSNALLVAVKLVVGLFSGSVAVIADGLNNLADATSSVISLLGFKIAAREADREHPFGHGRYEYIAALVVAALVLLLAVESGKNSIKKIINPTPITFGPWSFVVLAGAVLLKMGMALFNRELGRRINSTALIATSVDSRNDALSTGAVLVSMCAYHYFAVNLDGWIGLAVAGFIFYSGINLVKETLNPLVGAAPPVELADYISKKIAAYDGVLGTHDLMVHDYGPSRRFASAHVEMSKELDVIAAHDIIDTIQRDFLENDDIHLTLHHDPIADDEETYQIRAWVEEQVKTIDERLTIHDLRLIKGRKHMNYIFDVVVPPKIDLPEEELRRRIEQVVQQGRSSIHVIVNIDSPYVITST